jgi:hypothetical protein
LSCHVAWQKGADALACIRRPYRLTVSKGDDIFEQRLSGDALIEERCR